MKNQLNRETRLQPHSQRLCMLGLASMIALACVSGQAKDNDHKTNQYRQTNLVSDQSGVAMLQDTNLVNAWGISFSATSPFWVSANGTGMAELYSVTNDASGAPHVSKVGLEVAIPGDGTPTGQAFNSDTNAFNGDLFLFASEDGTISGWRGALGMAAETLTNRSSAVYKGLTLVSTSNGLRLLAANFAEGTVDVYDGSMNLVGQFADSKAPTGYAPFNVRLLAGQIFVTFAKQNAEKHDDVAGRGHGLIDVFDLSTGKFHRFATGSDAGGKLREIDSPWGMALSPAGFGKQHGDQLLVGNFGSGTIMTFDANGKFKGLLKGGHNRDIVIDGLWGLAFGNGGRAGVPDTLYFSAGPSSENHGLFGSLESITKDDKNNDNKQGNDNDDQD
jgi:uncharacterized protein (TIGR03118 family)